jgi:hypothetical protein
MTPARYWRRAGWLSHRSAAGFADDFVTGDDIDPAVLVHLLEVCEGDAVEDLAL